MILVPVIAGNVSPVVSPSLFAKWVDVPLHTVTTRYHLLYCLDV